MFWNTPSVSTILEFSRTVLDRANRQTNMASKLINLKLNRMIGMYLFLHRNSHITHAKLKRWKLHHLSFTWSGYLNPNLNHAKQMITGIERDLIQDYT